MKIIVADDEYFARVALISMLEELTGGRDRICEVENGEELIQKAEEMLPDLVFLDIKMPKMGGLEAFEVLQKQYPSILWVIVSGYADFSYARQALVLGARDYLMKPVNETEVKRVLEKMEEELEAERERKTRSFSSDMNLWLCQGQFCEKLSGKIFCGTLLCKAGKEMPEEEKETAQRLLSLCGRMQEEAALHGTVLLSDGSLALVSAGQKEEELEKSHDALTEKGTGAGETGGGWNRLYTGVCRNERELSDRLLEFAEEKACHLLLKAGQLLSWEQMKRIQNQHPEILQLCSMVDTMAAGFLEKEYGPFDNAAKKAIKIVKEEPLPLSVSMTENIHAYLMEMTEKNGEEAFETPVSLRSIACWEKFVKSCEKAILEKRKSPAGGNTAEKIAAYISAHFDQDISVSQAAELFCMTPNYLSTIFKNEMGVSFVQYLTDVRMEKARELLACGNLSVSAVAEQTGYRNAGYFARVFREYQGIHPSEFRKRMANQD